MVIRRGLSQCHSYTDQHYEKKRGQYSSRTSHIKIYQREGACLLLFDDDAGDEITTYDKEHIYTNVTPTEPAEPSMEQNNRDNCKRSQTINLGTICKMIFFAWSGLALGNIHYKMDSSCVTPESLAMGDTDLGRFTPLTH